MGPPKEAVTVASVNSSSARQSHRMGSQKQHCFSRTCHVVPQTRMCKMPLCCQAWSHLSGPMLCIKKTVHRNALASCNFRLMMQPWPPWRFAKRENLQLKTMQRRLGTSRPVGLGLIALPARRDACSVLRGPTDARPNVHENLCHSSLMLMLLLRRAFSMGCSCGVLLGCLLLPACCLLVCGCPVAGAHRCQDPSWVQPC